MSSRLRPSGGRRPIHRAVAAPSARTAASRIGPDRPRAHRAEPRHAGRHQVGARGLRRGLRSRQPKRIADGVKIVEKSYTDRGMKRPQIRTFDNYRELVARKRHRRGGHQHAGSLACRGGAGRGQRRQGRLSTEAVHDDARRGRDPARRGAAQRAHPAGGQPAAFLGAVPARRRAHPLGPHRQRAARGDRPAHRSDRARRGARGRFRPTSISASG